MIGLAVSLPSFAATIVLNPVADTTLIQSSPNNNMGAQFFVNAGGSQQTNLAGIVMKNRGLFQFDFRSIPVGSKIRSVSLTLEVVLQQTEPPTPSNFDLHRVLRPWGEGTNTGTLQKPGQGAPATTGEATWNNRLALTTNAWTVPGAASPDDFSPVVSASAAVFDSHDSPYHFGTSPGLEADVQFWLNNPQLNYGWIFISESEGEIFTARRFGSREDPDNAPALAIDFFPPPQIQSPQIVSNRIQFSFIAESDQSYIVQATGSLPSTNWTLVTNIAPAPTATNVTISQALSTGQQFYRVIAPQ
ncbi:MAG: hypothetical protein JWM68_2999 [Verrucomicrobiales bacterium]|nr:hypothetical protein [Verrucomicrobiales bacterium]